jgi:carbon monoxide dehydrogenase subunit G
MELDHEFTVPVPVEQAWPVLLDVERIAPCMPGAALDSIDGDEFAGRLKVRLGAMTITYRGSARISSRDEAAHTVTLEGSGKEARGAGTAKATVRAELHGEGERTRVTVHTTLNITGRPAQFGRGILAEVGGKLVGRFADNLAEEISRDEPGGAVSGEREAAEEPETAAASGERGAAEEPETAAASGKPGTAPPEAAAAPRAAEPARDASAAEPRSERAERPEADAVDLLEVAGPSIAKRLVAPLLGGLVVIWTLRRVFRRRR